MHHIRHGYGRRPRNSCIAEGKICLDNQETRAFFDDLYQSSIGKGRLTKWIGLIKGHIKAVV